MHVHVHTVIDFVNEADSLIAHIQDACACGPYIDGAPVEEKARLAIGLLGIIGDYAQELSALSDAFAESLPRRALVEARP